MKPWLVAFSLLALPATASANQRTTASCAARLNQPAQFVYQAAAPEAPTAPSLRGLLKVKTIALIRSGRLARNEARPAALGAFRCLKRLR